MKIASIVLENSFFEKNRLFNLEDTAANRDNCLLPFYQLKQALLEQGFELSTSDIHNPRDADIVIYNEIPKNLPSADNKFKSYLILFESELIRPDNWDLDSHEAFNKIFTWSDHLIDDRKYFKINFSYSIPNRIPKVLSSKEKLCTLIAGNKRVNHPLELYSKRIKAIRWFEESHPTKFDLYGVGWDQYRFSGPRLIRALNRIPWLTKLFASDYPSYKGVVDSKKPVLTKYKFAICYENACDISGYITEKIFDCFFAGCVPIYWGADNIAEHIPPVCFIDKREFETYEELYKYIDNMSDEEYIGYLDNIQSFLNSEEAYQFSSTCFVKTVIGAIVDQKS